MAEIKLNEEQSIVKINISGVIDGDQQFPPISSEVTSVSLDFNGLKYINSSGLRNWIAWKNINLSDHRVKLYVYNCPECFVEQLNVLKDILPAHSKVMSFKIPYYVEEVDKIVNVALSRDEDYVSEDVKYQESIDVDGHNAEIDVDVKEYFSFLRFFG